MSRYANQGGDSPITRYWLLPEAVRVEFKGKGVYTYSHASAGAAHVERMKLLAMAGRGLSTYIAHHVHLLYEK